MYNAKNNNVQHDRILQCSSYLEQTIAFKRKPQEPLFRHYDQFDNQLYFTILQVILKMDKQGNGLEIDQSNLGRCRSLGNVLTEEKFRYMCILSGCDYLPSLHGIGLSKACKVLRLAKDPDILKVSPDDEKVMLGFQR